MAATREPATAPCCGGGRGGDVGRRAVSAAACPRRTGAGHKRRAVGVISATMPADASDRRRRGALQSADEKARVSAGAAGDRGSFAPDARDAQPGCPRRGSGGRASRSNGLRVKLPRPRNRRADVTRRRDGATRGRRQAPRRSETWVLFENAAPHPRSQRAAHRRAGRAAFGLISDEERGDASFLRRVVAAKPSSRGKWRGARRQGRPTFDPLAAPRNAKKFGTTSKSEDVRA